MRLLPISLLYTIFASVVIAEAGSTDKGLEKGLKTPVAAVAGSEIKPAAADADLDSDDSDLPKPTIFNGVEVPPLANIDGEKFDVTVKDGYWFVKHHSPYCPHCIHVAPTWQTLYEYYFTSKPVPAGSKADSASTSMNTFTAYYGFKFGNLDCVAFGTACSDHKVGAFPTFVLYKDGVEVKRFEGTKDMKGLSDFVEAALETIRPGSRPVGGPKLPETGAKTSSDFEAPAAKEDKPAGLDVPTKTAAVDAESSVIAKPAKAENSQAPLKDAKADAPLYQKEDLRDVKGEAPLKATAADASLNAAQAANLKTTPGGKPLAEKVAGDAKGETSTKPLKATPVQSKPKVPSATANTAGGSIPLTAESFQNLVTMSQDPWFIKFYAPWCHHCQAMQPIWVQLGKEMKGRLNIGEVNCDVEKRLCKDVRVRGFPTILFFQGGERVEYDGLRGLGDFVTYANKAIDVGQGVKYVDAATFTEMEEKEEVIFVYFYDHATTSEDFAALERLTLSLIGHAKLVKTDSSILAERYKITTWPRLLVSRDSRPTYYNALAPNDMRDFRQVLQWMQSVWLPIVPELTASNSKAIMDGKLVVLGILTRERPDEFAMAKKEIKSAALEWMDKQIQTFQRERQELRDAKQLRIEEAEDRNDQRALRAAKSIRINMDRTNQKEVGFAWVDGVFWERWIRSTYGIEVKTDGEKVIINDEDSRRYWDQTVTGNYIIPSRTSILETIKEVSSPLSSKIKAKSTIGSIEKFFFNIRGGISGHPFLSVGTFVGVAVGVYMWYKGRLGRRRSGGFFRLDEKDGILGVNAGGKVD